MRKVLRSKIHRATVTHANAAYEGSVTIPPELLQAADIMPYEAVQIWDVTNGARFETYAIAGEDNSTAICVNGAAAHLVSPGDTIIIACFGHMDQESLYEYKPRLVFVDSCNRIKELRAELAGPRTRDAQAA